MVETVERPTFRWRDFAGWTKRPGISAIVRLRNEGEFGWAALTSIQPFFDEIVIVYNDSADRTSQIVAEFARAHPRQVRAYHYVPRVAPRGSRDHRTTSVRDPRSLVYYYNFALSRATCRVRCKWDGDEIAEPAALGRVIDTLRGLTPGSPRWFLSPWWQGYWWFTGVNLWDHQGEALVIRRKPLIGSGRDSGFWPAGGLIYYKAHPACEYLFKRTLVPKYVGCVFHHVQGMKADRGNTNFYFADNPDSLYRGRMRPLGRRDLITFDELKARVPELGNFPAPSSIDFDRLRNR
jgi:hypothetical protein